MANNVPHARLTGTVKFYLAIYGTTEPDVSSIPGADWIELGPTDGEQTTHEFSGALTEFRDNDHQGPVKVWRPDETLRVMHNIVGLTYENWARILHQVGNVITNATDKVIPFKRGAVVAEYALLARGSADSPYGSYPAHNYYPRVASDAEPTITRARDGSPMLEANWLVLEDDNQTDAMRLGWGRAKTS